MIDLDPQIADALDRHTPLPDEEGDWNRVLREAGVTRPTVRRHHAFGRRLLAVAAALVVVTGASLAGVTLLGGGPSTLDRARAAVTITSTQVLHERIVFSATSGPALASTEVWVQGATPQQYRVVANTFGRHPGVPAHYEQGGTLDRKALRTDVYNPSTNSIQRSLGFGNSGFLPLDPATSIRDALATRNAHVVGKRKLNGRTVVAIRLTSLASDSVGWGVEPGGDGRATVLVDPATYAPVEIEFGNLSGITPLLGTPHFGGTLTLIERFTTLERLASTPANLALTSLTAQHPNANCQVLGLSRPCSR